MSAILQAVRRTIRRYELCPSGSRVIAGISGGSDSVALSLVLQALAAVDGFSFVALAHLNHRLRPTAGRDEDFCRAFACRLGLPIAIESVDVGSYAQAQGLSVEDAARRVRYDFLHRVAGEYAAGRIAVGHTRDDQSETFLLKLARGAGLTGLGGVYPRRGQVIRPLLDLSRSALRAHLVSSGEAWVEDETNDDVSNPRNRIRHRVLPELDEVSGGRASAAIARAAEIVREDGGWLDELAERRFADIVQTGRDGLEVDLFGFSHEPVPLKRRVLLKALKTAAAGREIGFEHVESALDVVAGRAGGADVPGCRVELRRGKLVLLSRHVENDGVRASGT